VKPAWPFRSGSQCDEKEKWLGIVAVAIVATMVALATVSAVVSGRAVPSAPSLSMIACR
jgi:hypothetical protein